MRAHTSRRYPITATLSVQEYKEAIYTRNHVRAAQQQERYVNNEARELGRYPRNI